MKGRAYSHSLDGRGFFYAMISARVEVKLPALEKFRGRVLSELRHSRRGPIHDVFMQWSTRYRAFLTRRFNKYSRGGSDSTGPAWKPLKQPRRHKRDVKAKKKKGRSAKGNAILVDSGTLKASLSAMQINPGMLQKQVPYGLEIGFGGPARHPKGKGVSIADIGNFHHYGKGNLPERKIIVPPTDRLKKSMARDMQRGIDRLLGM